MTFVLLKSNTTGATSGTGLLTLPEHLILWCAWCSIVHFLCSVS